jgi:hypothetical protein
MAEGAAQPHKTLYKKYFKSAKAEGFLTLRPWLEACKFQVEVGDVSDGALKSVSIAYVDAIELATYLRAVISGHAEALYPADVKNGIHTPESYVAYGGGNTPGGDVVARIVKIHHWSSGGNADSSAFAWKCGTFEGRRTNTGAVVPDLQKPITQNMIRVTRQEMAIISYRADLALQGHLAKVGEEFWQTPS